MTNLLERRALPPVSKTDEFMEPDLAFSTLAKEASKQLGYHKLAQQVAAAQAKIHATPLQNALREVGVQPFMPESVERYKAEQLHKVMADANQEYWKRPEVYRRRELIAVWICIASTILGFMWLVSAATFPGTVGGTWWLFTSSIAVGPVITVVLIKSIPSHRRFVWRSIPISTQHPQYTAEIPTFVLQLMISIKKAYPDARFYVEEIAEAKKADPFLVVQDAQGSESFYVEVWKEPGFREGKLV